jgi:hypothetical protein
MKSINITAYPSNETEIDAIKAFMKALKIKFEVVKKSESPYNPEFVAKIQKGDEDLKNGKGKKMTLAQLERLCK